MTNALVRNTEVKTYPVLLRRVKETLLEGQRRIEAEKVRTYWEAGRLIQTHVLQNGGRAEYGKQTVLRLAEDLEVSVSVLQRCVQFVQKYPSLEISATSRKLTWSHYQELLAVSDDKERLRLERAIDEGGLTIGEVRARKNAQRSNGEPAEDDGIPSVATTASAKREGSSDARLTPVKGALYTYKILKPKSLAPGVESALVVDLGFSVKRNVEPRLVSNFSDGDVVASIPREDAYRFSKSGCTAKDLYTYNAYVERVIDGDTLKVRIDLGFDIWVDQTLRLRGIDCPELKTKDGDAAKAYVQSLIKEADRIVIRSSRSDKYDRYLADIFIPAVEGGAEVYLNALLVEKGYAGRWEG